MNREIMLNKAKLFAYEAIDNNSALSDARYEEIKDDTNAVETLALEFLQEAADYTEETIG